MILQSARTKPPNPLTEAELIEIMDRHGVGTDSTIVSAHVPIFSFVVCIHRRLSPVSLRCWTGSELGLTEQNSWQYPEQMKMMQRWINLWTGREGEVSKRF